MEKIGASVRQNAVHMRGQWGDLDCDKVEVTFWHFSYEVEQLVDTGEQKSKN